MKIIQLSGKSIQSIDGSFSDIQSHPNDDNKSIGKLFSIENK